MILLAGDPAEQERRGSARLSQGWAIGTAGWRKAVAQDHADLALHPGIEAGELQELREARWAGALAKALTAVSKSTADLGQAPKGAAWKIELADGLRREVGGHAPVAS